MQYTVRNVPDTLDAVLRQAAREQHKTLNEVVIEALSRAMGMSGEPARQRDLSAFAGSWVDDAEAEAALLDQRRVDPDLWR